VRAGHRRNAVIAALTILLVLNSAGRVGAAAFQRQVVSEGNRATARLVAAEAASVREVQPGLSKQLSLVAYRLDPDTGTPSGLDGELQSGAKWVILPGVEPGGRLESAAKWNALFTHRVRVASAAEIDDEIRAWLRDAMSPYGETSAAFAAWSEPAETSPPVVRGHKRPLGWRYPRRPAPMFVS
jgi:hypothetical protein